MNEKGGGVVTQLTAKVMRLGGEKGGGKAREGGRNVISNDKQPPAVCEQFSVFSQCTHTRTVSDL